MEILLADRIKNLGSESAFEVLNHAKKLEAKGMDVVHLEIGQPDFDTPSHISETACNAINSGDTHYSPAQGEAYLREALAKHIKKYKNVNTNAEEIVVVPGGKPVMFYTMLALVNPGDEVLYPNPGFPIYESLINFTGGVPVPVPVLQENDFKYKADVIESLITDKTKLLIINSPGNPTGGVMEEEDIRAIAEVLERHPNVFVLSDEIYDRLCHGNAKPFSMAAIPEMKDRTIILDGFSKPYSMTGWRIGYGVMHKEIAKAMTTLMVNSNSCVAAFTQQAALSALEGPQDIVEEMKNAYKERLEYVVSQLNKIEGISCLMPQGSFYAFPSIEGLMDNDKEFQTRLLEEAGVAVLPGSSFGVYGKGHVRLSAATSMEVLEEAVKRIARFAEKIRKENKNVIRFNKKSSVIFSFDCSNEELAKVTEA